MSINLEKEIKATALVGAFLSAVGVSYFVWKTLYELGDWRLMWAQSPNIIIAALIATIPAALAAWGAIYLIEKQKDMYHQVLKFVLMVVLSWGWLYIGLVVVGFMRLN